MSKKQIICNINLEVTPKNKQDYHRIKNILYKKGYVLSYIGNVSNIFYTGEGKLKRIQLIKKGIL